MDSGLVPPNTKAAGLFLHKRRKKAGQISHLRPVSLVELRFGRQSWKDDGLRPGCTSLGGRALIEKVRWYSTAVFREPPHKRLVQEGVHRCTVILVAAKAELGRQIPSFLNAGVHSDCFHEVYDRVPPIQRLCGNSCGRVQDGSDVDIWAQRWRGAPVAGSVTIGGRSEIWSDCGAPGPGGGGAPSSSDPVSIA